MFFGIWSYREILIWYHFLKTDKCIPSITVMLWHSWLRHCATGGMVMGSITDGVIGIFHRHNPSGLGMALGLTQPLTEISTMNISWVVKAVGVWGWQTYDLHVAVFLKSGKSQPPETLRARPACNGIALPLPSCQSHKIFLILSAHATCFDHYWQFSGIKCMMFKTQYKMWIYRMHIYIKSFYFEF
jgi:hypothetical protein